MNIYFFLCEGNHILRTGDDAQLAAFASVGVYHDGTFHLAHNILYLWIIRILMIEIQNIFQHPFGFYSRRLRVEGDCFHIAVYGMLPVALAPVPISLLIPLFCCHFFPAFNVFIISEQMVIGPTPPGTGVI